MSIMKLVKLEKKFTKLIGILFITFFDNSVKACFPLYGGGTCGGGGGTFCSPSYSAPAYSYPSAVDQSYSGYAPYGGQGQYAQQPYHASKSRTMGSTYSASNNLDSCLRRFPDTRLACALPFERRTPSDERECQRHCLNSAPRCHSFQYDPLGSVCDLFEHTLASEAVYGTTTATTLGDSIPSYPFSNGNDGWKGKKRMGKNVAIVEKQKQRRERRFVLHNGVLLDGHSKAMLTGMGHGGALAMADVGFSGTSSSSSTNNNNCVPSLESRSGVLFIGIDPGCDISTLAYDDEEDNILENNLPIPSPATAPSTVGQLEPMPAPPKLLPSRRAEMPYHQTTLPASAAIVGHPEMEMLDCPDGARARVQLIDGISLTGQRVLVAIQLDSADVCLHVCRQNAHLDGLHFPSQCRAATFHRQSGRCEILGEAISPNGPLQYTPNPDSLYFEKICIPHGDLPLGCDDVIHRIPQHHLDPRRVAGSGTVQTASSQLECIQKCIQAKVRLGFECASASYFFDWPTQNCFLTRFTRLSRPDMYSAERKELVDYMEMPPCFQLATGPRQHDSLAVGWSACIGGLRWRKKANCTTVTVPNECTESEACTTETGMASTATALMTKSVAPNIEVAKRFRAPTVVSNEASLFGEQDYEHQKEISFFGPPHGQQSRTKNAAVAQNEDGIDDGFVDVDIDEGNENEILPEPSTPSTNNCDPRIQCCPIEELDGPKGIVRGCSLGTRQLADGRKVSCVPDKCQ